MSRPVLPWLLILLGIVLPIIALACRPKAHLGHAVEPQTVYEVPRTQFPPPASVPSVSAAASSAHKQAGTVHGRATELYPRIAAASPATIDREKPAILSGFGELLSGLQSLLGMTAATEAEARSNDLAVKVLAGEVDSARQMVMAREQTIQQIEQRHAEELRRQAKVMADNEALLGRRIAELESAEHAARQKAARGLYLSAVALGGLLIFSGGAMALLMPGLRTPGLIVSGAGIACVAMGQAGLVYGQVVALIGIGIGLVVMVGAVIAAVRLNRNAAKEIADGIQQAIIAGKISFDQVKEHLDQAQSPLAKRLVDEATK